MPGLPRSKNGTMCLEKNLTIPTKNLTISTKDDLIETVNACESKLEKAIFWLEFPVYGIFEEKEGVSEKANIVIDANQKVIFFKKSPGHKLQVIKKIIEIFKR